MAMNFSRSVFSLCCIQIHTGVCLTVPVSQASLCGCASLSFQEMLHQVELISWVISMLPFEIRWKQFDLVLA